MTTKIINIGPMSDESIGKMANRIALDSTTVDAIISMSDGNPGALTVLGELAKTPAYFIDMCHLDDEHIYGSDIWIGYKDVCNFDINKFIEMARNRTLKKAIEDKT